MQGLQDILERARARSLEVDHPVLASVTEVVPPMDALDVLAATQPVMFWSNPSARFAIVAAGTAHSLPTGPGEGRFGFARDRWSALLRHAIIEGTGDGPGEGPLFVGGMAFDPLRPISATWRGFDHGALTVPQLSFVQDADRCTVTVNALVAGNADVARIADELRGARARAMMPRERWPMGRRSVDIQLRAPMGPASWTELVQRAVEAIRSRQFEKVVLAREQFGEVIGFDIVDALRFLVEAHPSTFVFATWRDDAVFFGATPERLVRVDGRRMRTSALAGSADRTTDAAGTALATNAKDRAEHEIVRRDIEAHLGDVCDDIRVGTAEVVALRTILHLHTPVEATLRDRMSIFDVLDRLHPTPAVGGSPRTAALRFIREQEGLDRGWYAGPVGWVGRESGEFAVALRCALVRGELAHTFAGCGIVGQSDPDAEWRESALKMRTAVEALSAGISGTPRPLSHADRLR